MPSVCRVCLVGDVKMYSLENRILEIYQKLTTTKLSLRGPQAVCYICHSLLQRCHRFTEIALYSENTLQDLHNKGIEASHENILKLNPTIWSSLSASSTQIMALNNIKDSVSTPQIKEELVTSEEEIDVKEEVATIEVEFVVNDEFTEEEPVPTAVYTSAVADQPMEYILFERTEATNYKDKREDRCCYKSQNMNGLASNNFINTKILLCDQCGKTFSQKKKLLAHIHCHNQVTFANDICNEKFTNKYFLNKHLLYTHQKVKPHLTSHRRQRHKVGMPYVCHICDKKFSDKYYLTIHWRTHTGERPYACNICARHFYRKATLSDHMRIHTGERPYACDICDKKYTRQNTLTGHMRTHTGERPYVCDICDKKFVYKSALTQHRRCHTGERPYACDICDKTFNLKSSLTKHMRTHTRKTICL